MEGCVTETQREPLMEEADRWALWPSVDEHSKLEAIQILNLSFPHHQVSLTPTTGTFAQSNQETRG